MELLAKMLNYLLLNDIFFFSENINFVSEMVVSRYNLVELLIRFFKLILVDTDFF